MPSNRVADRFFTAKRESLNRSAWVAVWSSHTVSHSNVPLYIVQTLYYRVILEAPLKFHILMILFYILVYCFNSISIGQANTVASVNRTKLGEIGWSITWTLFIEHKVAGITTLATRNSEEYCEQPRLPRITLLSGLKPPVGAGQHNLWWKRLGLATKVNK